MKCLERFLNYVRIDTSSDPESSLSPSSEGQKRLGNLLVKEMKEMKIDNAFIDEFGYVYAYLPANAEGYPVIGLIAHLDTSPECDGKNINPRVIENYDGENIVLNEEKKIVMKTSEFPDLKKRKSETLVVTDGLTLLGADDKAGIAEIMTVCEYLSNHPEFSHGSIGICFTPDEEIGRGTDKFRYDLFKVDFAFTVDGGKEGSVNYENFNAANCKVIINGINIHPGGAKGHMLNSISIAEEFDSLLPAFDVPENTEMYEGFNHLNSIRGTCEKTEMNYIIRNHDRELFEKQKNDFRNGRDFINKKYGNKMSADVCELTITDNYFNMREIVEKHPEIINLVKKATGKVGLKPIVYPIRGGTDGARLTFNGVICPNLGTGGANCHGRYEYLSAEGMKKSIEIILNIISLAGNM